MNNLYETPPAQIKQTPQPFDAAEQTTPEQATPSPMPRSDSVDKATPSPMPHSDLAEQSTTSPMPRSDSAEQSTPSPMPRSDSAEQSTPSQTSPSPMQRSNSLDQAMHQLLDCSSTSQEDASQEDASQTVITEDASQDASEENASQENASEENASQENASQENAREEEVNQRVPHVEYVDSVIRGLAGTGRRQLIRPVTNKPRLLHHGIHVYPAVCAFAAVDDSVRLAKTGILWRYQDIEWEVVLIGSLGWANHGTKRNRRSHQIVPKGPMFVWARKAAHVGKAIDFYQLHKIHVGQFFLNGDPYPTVSPCDVGCCKLLLHEFMLVEASSITKWESVPIYKSKAAPTTKAPRRKKRSRRILDLEEKQMEANAAQQRREEERTVKAIKAAEAKAAKLETQRRTRAIQREVKAAIQRELVVWKKTIAKQVSTMKLSMAASKGVSNKSRKEVQAQITAIHSSLDEIMCTQLTEVRNDLKNLTASLQKTKKLCVKRCRDIDKAINTMKQEVGALMEEVRTPKPKPKPKKKKKYHRVLHVTNENLNPVVTNNPLRRPDTPMVRQTRALMVSQTRPPTSMIGHTHSLADNNFGVMSRSYGHPNFPTSTPTGNGGQQQFISPMYAGRNIAT